MEMWFFFSAGREGNTRTMSPHHEESRCLYKVRARSQDSQESAMRGKGNRILIPSPCIVSKTVVDWLSVTR